MAVRSAFLVEGMTVPLLCGRLPFQPCPAACRRDSGGRLPPHLPRAPSRREVARRTGGPGVAGRAGSPRVVEQVAGPPFWGGKWLQSPCSGLAVSGGRRGVAYA